jgi:hypothetical protein
MKHDDQIKRVLPVTTLFLDIGGVLLTDGWDHHARKRAATTFKLELAGMEARHHLTFDRLPQTGYKGIYLKQRLKDKLIEHKQYIDKYGEDLLEVRNWKWSNPK